MSSKIAANRVRLKRAYELSASEDLSHQTL